MTATNYHTENSWTLSSDKASVSMWFPLLWMKVYLISDDDQLSVQYSQPIGTAHIQRIRKERPQWKNTAGATEHIIYTIMFMKTLYKGSTETVLTQVIRCYNRKDSWKAHELFMCHWETGGLLNYVQQQNSMHLSDKMVSYTEWHK